MKVPSTLVAALVSVMLVCSTVAADDYDMDSSSNESSSAEPVVSTTPSVSPTATSSSPPSSSSTVGPTFAPPPDKPEAQTYIVHDSSNTSVVCLSMSAVFMVQVTNGQNEMLFNVTLAQNGEKGMVNSTSTCMVVNKTASVYIVDTRTTDFSIELVFNGTTNLWSIQSVGMMYMNDYFIYEGKLDSKSQNVTDTKFFKCDNLEFKLSNTSANHQNVTPTVTIKSLKVQVFQFKDNTGDLVGNGVACAADAGPNKIVPIAVGAALAGLVVVVLIAYLIGRLRSRKQSSYEALS